MYTLYVFRALELDEVKELKCGDEIAIGVRSNIPNRMNFTNTVVTRTMFWNSDADEPDWEVETDSGFADIYSLYKAVKV